jgi:hypothetical protein
MWIHPGVVEAHVKDLVVQQTERLLNREEILFSAPDVANEAVGTATHMCIHVHDHDSLGPRFAQSVYGQCQAVERTEPGSPVPVCMVEAGGQRAGVRSRSQRVKRGRNRATV